MVDHSLGHRQGHKLQEEWPRALQDLRDPLLVLQLHTQTRPPVKEALAPLLIL